MKITADSISEKPAGVVSNNSNAPLRSVADARQEDRVDISSESLALITAENKIASETEVFDVQTAEAVMNRINDALLQRPETASGVHRFHAGKVRFLSEK